MSVTVEEVNRNVERLRNDVQDSYAELKTDINIHETRLDDIEISRAELRGALRILTWLVGIGLAGPAAVVSWLALTGQLGG